MRNAAIVVALATLSSACARAGTPLPLPNPGFEQGAPGVMPPGWTARGALRRGFTVATNTTRPHSGRQVVAVLRDSMNMGDDYGAVAVRMDARPLRGKRVRLTGWIRYEGPNGWSGGSTNLYLRVDREAGRDGFSADTESQPLGDSEWHERTLVGEVASDADTLVVGLYVMHGGRGWGDDFALEDLGATGTGDEGPRPLTARGTENLVAFAKLLGYVRHFHPSDESAAADWDAFAIEGVRRVEGASDPAALAAVLRALFLPLAPTLRIGTAALPALKAESLRPAGKPPAYVTGWWHHGWGDGAPNFAYFDRRPRRPVSAAPDSICPPGAEVNAALGGGVWCSVPLTLYGNASGTLPRATGSRTRTPAAATFPSGRDRATRLADVILFWNVAQHFYPYFDVVGTDWPAQLAPTLARAAQDHDGAAFEETLHRLVATLHDGHGAVSSPWSDYGAMPLAWRFLGEHLVVTRVDSSLAGRIRPGDEVTALEGRPLADWVREREPTKSAATPQFLRERVAQSLQVLPGLDSVSVDLRAPGGATRRVRISRHFAGWMRPPRPDSLATLRPGIEYVDLDRVTDADFERALPKLERAKGVVFDLRGYPRRISTVPLTHLTDTVMTSARWNIPVVTRPDRDRVTFDFSNWNVPPRAPRLKGRVVFLIDGTAISYAETYLGIVENYRLAALVGEATAGTNGNINSVLLPGGYRVTFTGMKVLKHDGSTHHGIGILPTVPVQPTIAGIAAGRDEVLEKGIEVASR